MQTSAKCPIKDCSHVYGHGIVGWYSHVTSVANHPTWLPWITDAHDRKVAFLNTFPDFFSGALTHGVRHRSDASLRALSSRPPPVLSQSEPPPASRNRTIAPSPMDVVHQYAMPTSDSAECPLCAHTYTYGIVGWYTHVGKASNHPRWLQGVTDPIKRADAYVRAFPEFFEQAKTSGARKKSGPHTLRLAV